MKKKLYIFRGLPGSGKSTLANQLAALVVEPDMFRHDENRNYVFDSDKNAEVLMKTEDLLRFAMARLHMPCLAVAATHVKVEHMKLYITMGHDFGYEVIVIECRGKYGNIHKVPDTVVAKMAKDFEPLTAADAEELGVEIRYAGDSKDEKRPVRWAVTYVDVGETCDGKARLLKVCDSHEEALAAERADMEKWAEDHKDVGGEIDFSKMSGRIGQDDGRSEDGCEWSILKID